MRKKIAIAFICLIVVCSLASVVSARSVHDPRELKEPTPYSTWSSMYRSYEADMNGKYLISEEKVIREYEDWCRHLNFDPDYASVTILK